MDWPARRDPWRCLLYSLAGLAVVSAPGCGTRRPRLVAVSGRVLVDGKPLTGHRAFVRFVPTGGRAATGAVDPADGTFVLSTYDLGDGCVTGTHRIAVIDNVTVDGRLVWLIPQRYGDEATSDLTFTVDGPTDQVTLPLDGPMLPAPAASATEAEGGI